MGQIAIKLDPAKLENPDLDIRYVLPDLVEDYSRGEIKDGGYDYAGPDDDSLIIFLSTTLPHEACKTVIELLSKNVVCGNQLLDSAVIGVSEEDVGKRFEIAHPEEGGIFEVRD